MLYHFSRNVQIPLLVTFDRFYTSPPDFSRIIQKYLIRFVILHDMKGFKLNHKAYGVWERRMGDFQRYAPPVSPPLMYMFANKPHGKEKIIGSVIRHHKNGTMHGINYFTEAQAFSWYENGVKQFTMFGSNYGNDRFITRFLTTASKFNWLKVWKHMVEKYFGRKFL